MRPSPKNMYSSIQCDISKLLTTKYLHKFEIHGFIRQSNRRFVLKNLIKSASNLHHVTITPKRNFFEQDIKQEIKLLWAKLIFVFFKYYFRFT